VTLSGIHIQSLDGAKRFGWLIEVIYGGECSLTVSDAAERVGLFAGIDIPDHMQLEFRRILSRVHELTWQTGSRPRPRVWDSSLLDVLAARLRLG